MGIRAPETLEWLARSRDFLAESYNQPVQLEDAAKVACLSPFHFHRQFVRAYGETPHEFRTKIRLDEAKKLLVKNDLSVTEICFDLGYSSLGSFSSMFATRFGMSPREFREGARKFYQLTGYRGHLFLPICVFNHLR